MKKISLLIIGILSLLALSSNAFAKQDKKVSIGNIGFIKIVTYKGKSTRHIKKAMLFNAGMSRRNMCTAKITVEDYSPVTLKIPNNSRQKKSFGGAEFSCKDGVIVFHRKY